MPSGGFGHFTYYIAQKFNEMTSLYSLDISQNNEKTG